MFSTLSLAGLVLWGGLSLTAPTSTLDLTSRTGPNFVFQAYGRLRFWESASRITDFAVPWEQKYVARSSDGSDCGVTAEGAVECWVTSLGSGSPTQKDLVGFGNVLGKVVQFERGCLRTEDDHLYCLKTTATVEGNSTRYTLVDGSRLGGRISRMVASHTHACVLTAQGKVLCWGSDWAGKLGLGGQAIVQRMDRFQDDDGAYSLTEARPPVPRPVRPILVDPSVTFTDLSSISHTSCALSSQATDNLYCWGLLSSFSIGTDEAMGENNRAVSATPKRLDLSVIPERRLVGVAAGHSYGCGWTKSNQVFCWGTVEPERDTEEELSLKLTPIGTDLLNAPIRSLVTIGYRVCAITQSVSAEGELLYCTSFVRGEDGRTRTILAPVIIPR